MLGALWGRKFYIWEGMIYHIPIWDVFAPKWELGRAGEQNRMGHRIPSQPN